MFYSGFLTNRRQGTLKVSKISVCLVLAMCFFSSLSAASNRDRDIVTHDDMKWVGSENRNDSTGQGNAGSGYPFWGYNGATLGMCTPNQTELISAGYDPIENCITDFTRTSWFVTYDQLDVDCFRHDLSRPLAEQVSDGLCEEVYGPKTLTASSTECLPDQYEYINYCLGTPPPNGLRFLFDLDSAGMQVSIPLHTRFSGTIDVRFDWGDGATASTPSNCPRQVTSNSATTVRCLYNTAGTGPNPKVVTMWSGPTNQNMGIGWGVSVPPASTNYNRLVRVVGDHFGQPFMQGLTSLQGAFRNATSLVAVPTELPDGIVDLSHTFNGATAFNHPIGGWNTSDVTTLQSTFDGASAFNQDIGSWDVSNVMSLIRTFSNAVSFNQDIGGWNTSNVTSLNSTFSYALSFNQDIGAWDTSRVQSLFSTFREATSFNQPIGGWDTSRVTTMVSTFQGASSFNQPIGSWNTSRVESLSNTFRNAIAFNQPIGLWNTSIVTDMSSTFEGAILFNQPIGSWNTASVTDMFSIFNGAVSFNQYIGDWNTSSVKRMVTSFNAAVDFNNGFPMGASPVSNRLNWDVRSVNDMSAMFQDATSFNSDIIAWRLQCLGTSTERFAQGRLRSRVEEVVSTHGISRVYFASHSDEQNYFDPSFPSTEPINLRRFGTIDDMFNNAASFTHNLSTWQIPYLRVSTEGLPAARSPQYGSDRRLINPGMDPGLKIGIDYVDEFLPDQPARFNSMEKGVLTPKGYEASGFMRQRGAECTPVP